MDLHKWKLPSGLRHGDFHIAFERQIEFDSLDDTGAENSDSPRGRITNPARQALDDGNRSGSTQCYLIFHKLELFSGSVRLQKAGWGSRHQSFICVTYKPRGISTSHAVPLDTVTRLIVACGLWVYSVHVLKASQ